jgi:hypothetical protein
MWVNAGHTTMKIWEDQMIMSSKQAFLERLSSGLKNSSAREKIFLVLHIGNENGFVEG